MELFKLLGTIAVENSDANKAIDDTTDKVEDSKGKFSTAFSKMGQGAVVVGKTIATGLAVGAAAFTGLTIKALNMGGELEQNMGGSEAVFKGYAGKMQETAKTAFENMGLSTSNFLSTANKMGALFQGSGFDIQTSADLSSQAMQRAADVASIMGIDTASAMEAVAGAAKGNFTMMDNLGVAMNDTQIQAYALSKGIEKSTQEMSMQEKIGLAMEMFLDKASYAAGNYAKENETLAGSLGTAKAALSNFLDGSGDVDSLVNTLSGAADVIIKNIDELLPRLVTGVTDLINKLLPKIPPLLSSLLPAIVDGAVALVQGIVTALPALIAVLMGALPQLIEGFVQIVIALSDAIIGSLPTLLPALINGLVQLIVGLAQGLPQIIQSIIAKLPEILISVVNALMDNLPILIEGLVNLVVALVQALPTIIIALIEALPQLIESVINGLLQALPQLIEGCVILVIELVKALPQIIMALIQAIPTIITSIVKALWTVSQSLWDAFSGIFSGAWEGVKNVFAPVVDFFKNIFSSAWDGIKSIWNAVSGFFSGIWDGVKKTFSGVGNFFKDIFQGAYDGITGIFSKVGGFFKDVFGVLGNIIKAPVNLVIKGLNFLINGLNKVGFDIPDWVPVIGGKRFGFSIPNIPQLSEGGVLKKGQKGYLEGDGDEAVVPLEKNTGWIRQVANKIHDFSIQFKSEAVPTRDIVPINQITNVIKSEIGQRLGGIEYLMDKIISILAEFFPELLEAFDFTLVMDDGTVAAKLSPKIDRYLGAINKRKGRGN